MANVKELSNKTNTLIKEISNKRNTLIKELSEEEFSIYFEDLINKFYEILSTFDNSYTNYGHNLDKVYNLIKEAKQLNKHRFNNLDNYELGLRVNKADDIIYELHIKLHFLEEEIKRDKEFNVLMKITFITDNLKGLLEAYKKAPSEELKEVISNNIETIEYLLESDVMKEIKVSSLDSFVNEVEENINNISEGCLNIGSINSFGYIKAEVIENYETVKKELQEVI